jgi:DNA-binding transcriptional ArsR family regulator
MSNDSSSSAHGQIPSSNGRLTGHARGNFERKVLEGVKATDRLILYELFDFFRGKAVCWPGNEAIARAAGVSAMTASRTLKALEGLGIIKTVDDGSVRSRRRIILLGHPDAAEELARLEASPHVKFERCRAGSGPVPDQPQKVYFAQLPDGTIKIGCSGDVSKRLQQINNEHACRTVLLRVIDGDRAAEREIHKKFAHLRLGKTERFHPGPDLLEFISGSAPEPDGTKSNGSDKSHGTSTLCLSSPSQNGEAGLDILLSETVEPLSARLESPNSRAGTGGENSLPNGERESKPPKAVVNLTDHQLATKARAEKGDDPVAKAEWETMRRALLLTAPAEQIIAEALGGGPASPLEFLQRLKPGAPDSVCNQAVEVLCKTLGATDARDYRRAYQKAVNQVRKGVLSPQVVIHAFEQASHPSARNPGRVFGYNVENRKGVHP